jgi:chromosome segregation ATPase
LDQPLATEIPDADFAFFVTLRIESRGVYRSWTMSAILDVYELLKPKLGEQETRVLLDYVQKSVEHRAATKEDLREVQFALHEEIQQVQVSLQQQHQQLWVQLERLDQRTASKDELQQVHGTLQQQNHDLQGRLQRLEERMATKDELQGLQTQLRQLEQRAATKEELRSVESSLRQEIQAVQKSVQELEVKMESWKFDLVKWMFGFWLAGLGGVSGVFYLLMRFVVAH